MKDVKKRKVKCIKCMKLKTLACFGEVDMFWGKFKTRSWCKICDKKLDKQRDKDSKKFNENCEKQKKEFVKNGGVLKRQIVGACEESKGWYVQEGKYNRVITGIPIRKMERVV